MDNLFWAKVETRGPDECWPWLGCKMPNGYGKLGRSGKNLLAHRHSYSEVHGEIPDGKCVCHKCDNRICCNPSHLFLGSYADNLADMTIKGRRQRGDRHGNAKLNAEKVSRIRRFALKGVSGKALANVFGVSRSVISNVMNGHTWNHVGWVL